MNSFFRLPLPCRILVWSGWFFAIALVGSHLGVTRTPGMVISQLLFLVAGLAGVLFLLALFFAVRETAAKRKSWSFWLAMVLTACAIPAALHGPNGYYAEVHYKLPGLSASDLIRLRKLLVEDQSFEEDYRDRSLGGDWSPEWNLYGRGMYSHIGMYSRTDNNEFYVAISGTYYDLYLLRMWLLEWRLKKDLAQISNDPRVLHPKRVVDIASWRVLRP